MPRNEDDPDLTIIRKELEASLQRNLYLERENEQLKEEIVRLKGKVRTLKAQNLRDTSVLRTKVVTESYTTTTHHNQLYEFYISEKNPTEEKHVCTQDPPKPPPMPPPKKLQEGNGRKVKPAPPPPPPPRSEKVNERKVTPAPAVPPPPPPPPPSKFLAGSPNVVRRVPEVMEFYHSLTRKDTRIDSKTSLAGIQLAANAKNMIGEIENRSRYLMAIKSDVETQGNLIRFLIKEVENAAYEDIADVEVFVKWIDRKLSYLVDERAVLKHFPAWPEQKADAMREAAFSYRDLFNLESEVSSFKDNSKEPLSLSLKRMQSLQDRLERSVHNIQRTREGVSKRYRGFQIPCDWMLETGMINKLKLSSTRLAKEYMKRVTGELKTKEQSQREELMLQGARFAFRVHQFAGGFDSEAMHAFEELKKVGATHLGQQQHSSGKNNLC
ncbi:hypothetical protein ACHQM5_020713 [Ranunculus cassubicifolius]